MIDQTRFQVLSHLLLFRSNILMLESVHEAHQPQAQRHGHNVWAAFLYLATDLFPLGQEVEFCQSHRSHAQTETGQFSHAMSLTSQDCAIHLRSQLDVPERVEKLHRQVEFFHEEFCRVNH